MTVKSALVVPASRNHKTWTKVLTFNSHNKPSKHYELRMIRIESVKWNSCKPVTIGFFKSTLRGFLVAKSKFKTQNL